MLTSKWKARRNCFVFVSMFALPISNTDAVQSVNDSFVKNPTGKTDYSTRRRS